MLKPRFCISSFTRVLCNENTNLITQHSKEYWDLEENVHNFINRISNKYQTAGEWEKLSKKEISQQGGRYLFKKYSLFDIKCIGCPELKNKLKQNKPKGYWDNNENISHFFTELKEKYKLKTTEDWNKLTWDQVNNAGGGSLLIKHSLFNLKRMACPEIQTKFDKEKKRIHKKSRYWENEENIKKFINKLKEHYKLETINDWISLSYNDVMKFGGGSVLSKLTLFELKCLGNPEIKNHLKSRRYPKPVIYWDNIDNVKNFLLKVKEKLMIQTNDDWNKLNWQTIREMGGSGLLANKKYSLYDLQCLACPENKENFSNTRKPKGYWDNKDNIKNFFLEVKKFHQISFVSDWNRISTRQICDLGGYTLLSKYKYNFSRLLSIAFPGENWEQILIPFCKKRSTQRYLFILIQQLFPNDEIVEDLFHDKFSRISGFPVQFDVFIVNKNIAFEYHGKQHYEDIPSTFSPLELYVNRDKEKKQLCAANGILLIIIPHWWDNKLTSLREIVNQHPDFVGKHEKLNTTIV